MAVKQCQSTTWIDWTTMVILKVVGYCFTNIILGDIVIYHSETENPL